MRELRLLTWDSRASNCISSGEHVPLPFSFADPLLSSRRRCRTFSLVIGMSRPYSLSLRVLLFDSGKERFFSLRASAHHEASGPFIRPKKKLVNIRSEMN